MAEIENVVIFRADTGKAVQSLGDLRASISELKKHLNEAKIGTEDYDETLKQLQVQQAALKDAMHATSGEADKEAVSMETIAKAAKGAGESYNALVKRMAALDQEFRRTEDVAKRDLIGAQIKSINQKLKDMDAQRGKFQRNVGDYFGQGLTDNMRKVISVLQQMPGGFKNVATAAAGATNAFAALSATPVLGILGLLASALSKIIDGLKSSEENTDRWRLALAAFRPYADAATRAVQAIGGALADAANWIVDLLDKWGLLNSEARNYQGLESASQAVRDLARRNIEENAKLQRDADEHRAKSADKEKYTAQQRLAFLKEAQREEKAIMLNNLAEARQRLALLEEQAKLTQNDTRVNDELAQARANLYRVEAEYNRKMRELSSQTNTALNETRANAHAAISDLERMRQALEGEEIREAEDEVFIFDPDGTIRDENRQMFDDLIQQMDEFEKERERIAAIEQAAREAAAEQQRQLDEEEKARTKKRIEMAVSYVSAVSGLAGSLASIYEANGEADEEAAQKAKALRTAEAIISTLGGAVSAYMNTIESIKLPAVAIPLAIVNAATVLAAGYAQVRAMNAVPVGGSGGSGAMVSAPAAPVAAIQQVRTVTGASEVDRLNEAVGNIRAYVVESDITAKQDLHRRRTDEASF